MTLLWVIMDDLVLSERDTWMYNYIMYKWKMMICVWYIIILHSYDKWVYYTWVFLQEERDKQFLVRQIKEASGEVDGNDRGHLSQVRERRKLRETPREEHYNPVFKPDEPTRTLYSQGVQKIGNYWSKLKYFCATSWPSATPSNTFIGKRIPWLVNQFNRELNKTW